LNGLPIEPVEARKSFKRACGFQVSDNVYHHSRSVPRV
jgi:hypothetical protein